MSSKLPPPSYDDVPVSREEYNALQAQLQQLQQAQQLPPSSSHFNTCAYCGTVAVTKCQWGSSPQFTTKEDRTQCRRVLCPLHEQQRPWG
ncbi:unnamed protein product, partial [Didymodactylos carnosus]